MRPPRTRADRIRVVNITCIATAAPRTERRALAHAQALGRAGFRVTLFAALAPGTEPETDAGPVVIVRVPISARPRPRSGFPGCDAADLARAGSGRRYHPLVVAALERTQPDVIHAFGVDAAPAASAAACRLGIPFVLDDDGTSDAFHFARDVRGEGLGLRRWLLERMAARMSGRIGRAQRRVRREGVALVVVPTAAYADSVRRRVGGPAPLVVRDCFPAPRDTDPHRLRVRLGTFPGERLIVFHGPDGPGSGADAAVRALRILGNGHILVFVGLSGPGEHVAQVAQECGVTSHIRYVAPDGERQLIELLGAADVAVIPREPEGDAADLIVPATAYECLASGVPLVASDLPAVGALVRDTGAGVLYTARRPTDPGAVAEAVRTLLIDESLAATCRDRALAAARSELSWGHESQRLVEAYEQLAPGS